jgi:hypothetical protein
MPDGGTKTAVAASTKAQPMATKRTVRMDLDMPGPWLPVHTGAKRIKSGCVEPGVVESD